ncbi:NTP transferase domain-containing protein [Candidatus Woesearchaeota archaeon]|nr:NTP transferase domain-containing protein [Candidatus Woesearchaeota archaeon]
MQAVILAAGKSTRTYPLTLTRPKPLLKIANKPILEHNLDKLNGIADEAVLVVGYKKELIMQYFGYKHKNIKLKYIEQKQQLGTAHALSVAEPYIKNRFILMAGDDIYSKEDIKRCIKHGYSILAAKVKNPGDFGVILQKSGILTDIIEKPKRFVSNLITTSFYVLDKKIFAYIRQLKKSERNEFEMPDAIRMISKKNNIHCVNSSQWLPVGYPWDLLKADKILRKGKNIIGKGSRVYGKIMNSSIGNNCVIKGNVKNSIIMDNSIIQEGSIVGDSIIGENVTFSGKIHSKKNTFSIINNKKIRISVAFGAVVSDNVNAKKVIINPGCKIWPNKIISNRNIKEDVV